MFRSLFIAGAVIAVVAAVLVSAGNREPQTFDVFFNLKRASGRDEQIDSLFWDISDPARKSPKFRKFLSTEEIIDLHASPAVIVNKVRRFLEAEGACKKIELARTKDQLMCRTEAAGSKLYAAVEAAFAQKEVKLPGTYRAAVTTAEAVAPVRAYILSAVAYRAAPKVAGADKKKKVGNQFPGMTQTPDAINKRYAVPKIYKRVGDVTSAVGEFEGSYFNQADMDMFTQRYNLNKLKPGVVGPDVKPPMPNGVVVEVSLDLEYISSVSNCTTPTWFIAQGTDHKEPGEINFGKFITDRVLTMAKKPAVVSLSWGYGLQRAESEIDILWMDNAAFRKGGMAGVSILVASGDSGAGGRSTMFDCTTFIPGWPASSPYVTSVGANYANSEVEKEIVVDWSGGGFDNYFETPSWQKAHVESYLANAPSLPAAKYYKNATGHVGHGFPHVSALGTNFQIAVNGGFEGVSGTSAASPTFAGVLTQVIAERSAAGKGPLGYVSPTLFKLGKVGYDIVEGRNQFTNCLPILPIPAFPAYKGWDACSGLGSPNFDYLKEALMKDEY